MKPRTQTLKPAPETILAALVFMSLAAFFAVVIYNFIMH